MSIHHIVLPLKARETNELAHGEGSIEGQEIMEEYVKVQKIEMHEGVKEYFMNRIDALQAHSRKYVFFRYHLLHS